MKNDLVYNGIGEEIGTEAYNQALTDIFQRVAAIGGTALFLEAMLKRKQQGQ